MVKFINSNGNVMWVDESRVQEYLDAGHKLASEAPVVEEKPQRKPKTKAKK